MAIEVEGQLRVVNVPDCAGKSVGELQALLEEYKAKGRNLTPESQDIRSCCWIVSSLGKASPESALATLPRGATGILAVGRNVEGRGAMMNFTLCHATLTGAEGANVLQGLVEKIDAL